MTRGQDDEYLEEAKRIVQQYHIGQPDADYLAGKVAAWVRGICERSDRVVKRAKEMEEAAWEELEERKKLTDELRAEIRDWRAKWEGGERKTRMERQG